MLLSKSEKAKMICLGAIIGILISVILFFAVVYPTMKRLNAEKIERLESKMLNQIEDVYSMYYGSLSNLDPDDEWFVNDIHTLRIRLKAWIDVNESMLSDEQLERFNELYDMYCRLESESETE